MQASITVGIPFFSLTPVLERARVQAARHVSEVFEAGRYILGSQVSGFEQEFAAAMGGAYAVGTGSGTAALELCLRAAGLPVGSDVIVPANTSLFTAQAVLSAGLRPRFADVDANTLQLTDRSAEAAWTPHTSAVIGVHLYGNPCPVAELAVLCRERGVPLIQDACQAHGLRIGGRVLTEFSDYTAYSFYPTKNLGGVGDGGAVVTNSPGLANQFRLLRDGGRDNDQWARVPAINSRLSELHAAYLRAFLPHLGYWNDRRGRIAAVYDNALAGVPQLEPVRSAGDSVRHLYVIRTQQRDSLRQALLASGIETGVHYPRPLHRHPAFAGRSSWAAEPAEAIRAGREILSLPIGPHVDEDAASYVAREVGRFLGRFSQ